MVVNLEKLFSMKNCSMVKKILKILYTCLIKKVYYVFLFLKVSPCKFKQKETILKLGNPLKSKSKFTKSKIGWGASTSTLIRTLHWTHWGPSDSLPNFLSVYNSKIPLWKFVVKTLYNPQLDIDRLFSKGRTLNIAY